MTKREIKEMNAMIESAVAEARADEADKYADVVNRDSYKNYIELLKKTNGNGNEEDEKQRTILAVKWLEDVLEYFINKHDGECIKIEITNRYQR